MMCQIKLNPCVYLYFYLYCNSLNSFKLWLWQDPKMSLKINAISYCSPNVLISIAWCIFVGDYVSVLFLINYPPVCIVWSVTCPCETQSAEWLKWSGVSTRPWILMPGIWAITDYRGRAQLANWLHMWLRYPLWRRLNAYC